MPARKISDKNHLHNRPITLELPSSDATAHKLMNDIKAKRLDPHTIPKEGRRALLVVMAHGRLTSNELGSFFGVAGSTIRKEIMAIRQELGSEIRSWTLETVMGQLAAYAERCTAGLIKDGDWSAAWAVQRDFVRALKELGISQDSHREGDVRITIEGLNASTAQARLAIVEALDPELTGEVVAIKPKVVTPPLPLAMGRPDAPKRDPGISLTLKPAGQGDDEVTGSHEPPE